MKIVKIDIPGVDKAPIVTGGAWQITHHRLMNLSPEEADKVELGESGWTVWHLCFVEDLLQATNSDKGLLLDVGWYPDSDASGSYHLRLIRVHDGGAKGADSYDWQHPIVDFETRSLAELLQKIQELAAS